jgi:hypothetical protein
MAEVNYGPDNTTLKPIVLTAVEGSALLRFAERQRAPVALSDPPRKTR